MKELIYLKIIMDILFLIVIGYLIYTFIQTLLKMKGKVILPITNEEVSTIRKYPEKPIEKPTFSNQKLGIILYSILILFVIVMFLLGLWFDLFTWSVYLLLLLPMANSNNLLNMFAIVEDGLLSGNRFISWNKIKSYRFLPIDINHKYYGYSKEANKGYELKIKTIGFPVSCIITSEEMKEKLDKILSEHAKVIEGEM